MRPISVRFQCFGPYMAEQFIDFTRLEKNGLFLICGETGAGKTTILDAMCYALYGRSSGGLRGELSVMRCKLARESDETKVEFVFQSGGKRYMFTRSLKFGRKKLNDRHNCLVWEDDAWVPIFENPKLKNVNDKAQELIGLTYDQFRQVIILPQGQFEKLLVSDSAEKEKILVSLFHADRWQRIADEVYRRVQERDNALKNERLAIDGKLREYGCAAPEELQAQAEAQAAQLEELGKAHSAAEEHHKALTAKHEAALLENRDFEELAARKKKLDALLPRSGEYDREEGLLDLADRAEGIGPEFSAYQEAMTRREKADAALTRAEKALTAAREKLDKAKSDETALEAARPQYESRKRSIMNLEEKRELYHSLARKQEDAAAAQAKADDAGAAAKKAETAFEKKHARMEQALTDQAQVRLRYDEAQAVYLAGIGSTLASKLEEGRPCPVCGSVEHPAPAKPAPNHVSEEELDRLNKAMNAANDAVTASIRARNQAEEARNQARTVCNTAAQAAALAANDLENALAQRIAGIESTAQLEEKLKGYRDRVARFEKNEAQTRQAVTDANAGLLAAQAGLDKAGEEAKEAAAAFETQQALWLAARTAAGFDSESQYRASVMKPEEKQRRRAALIRFRTELSNARTAYQEQQTALEGREAPDLAGIKAELDAARQNAQALSNQAAVGKQRLDAMTADAASLARRQEKLLADRTTVDADLDFANRLRGRSGISLQRYVLGVMLTSITVEANRLLENVYGGRYRLHRTDEIAGSGHKGGLELEVYDAANNQTRSVTTLSGGEKFLVALSLAIGLSTVVQAQGGGIRLEAMFIDEGFGSLDREAIGDALDVLQGIRRSCGIVGIISHVEQLAETIPTRLEIRKGSQGSSCVVVD